MPPATLTRSMRSKFRFGRYRKVAVGCVIFALYFLVTVLFRRKQIDGEIAWAPSNGDNEILEWSLFDSEDKKEVDLRSDRDSPRQQPAAVGLGIEGGTVVSDSNELLPNSIIASTWTDWADVDRLATLVYSLRRSSLGVNFGQDGLTFRLYVSPLLHLKFRDMLQYTSALAKLHQSGWQEAIVAALSPEILAKLRRDAADDRAGGIAIHNWIAKSLFLCGDEVRKLRWTTLFSIFAQSPMGDNNRLLCANTMTLLIHPFVFFPSVSQQSSHPLSSIGLRNFFTRENYRLISTVFVGDRRPAALLSSCVSESLTVEQRDSIEYEKKWHRREGSIPYGSSDSVIDAWRIRLLFASPIEGLTVTHLLNTQVEVACHTAWRATNRVHPDVATLQRYFFALYGGAANARNDDEGAELDAAARQWSTSADRGFAFLSRTVDFTVPIAMLDDERDYATMLDMATATAGKFYFRLGSGPAGLHSRLLEVQWWIELYESLALSVAALDSTTKSLDGRQHFYLTEELADQGTKQVAQLLFQGTVPRVAGPSVVSRRKADASRNVTTEALRVFVGGRGASCLQVCNAQSLGCAPAALQWWFPNSCDALKLIFAGSWKHCVEDVVEKIAAVAPALRPSDGVLVARNPRMAFVNATCAASEPSMERVCACIDVKVAATAQMTRLDDRHMLRYMQVLKDEEQAAHHDKLNEDLHHSTGSNGAHSQNVADNGNRERDDRCPCPVASSQAATEELEMACLEYIGNYSNVVAVEPMASSLKYGRTVKFMLKYRDDCVRAIMKPPQASFPLEPHGEYVAYEFDRMLNMSYVPPTTWIFVPLVAIEIAAQSSPHHSDQREYALFVGNEVLLYVVRSSLVVTDSSGRVAVGCSVQLHVKGVRWHKGTPLYYDDTYLALLTPRLARLYADRSLLSDYQVTANILKAKSQRENVDKVLPYLSDTVIFDTVLANDDRGSQKNSHVYFSPHYGEFRYLHLDQGKSFYPEFVAAKSLLDIKSSPTWDSVPTADGTFVCLFRRETVRRLKSFTGSARLSLRMKDLIPPPIFDQIGDQRFIWAETRLEHILRHFGTCKELLGDDAVMPWG